MKTILDLPDVVAALSPDLRRCWDAIYSLRTAIGRLVPPATMDAWIARQFGTVEAVREQPIIAVTNQLTLEAALFNPLRARRPAGMIASDGELAAWMSAELADDIFAQPLRDTPADSFGRIVGRFCVTASNIAKYDGWHGLVIPNEPDPLRFERDQLHDYLEVALRWVAAAHASDERAIYPVITWNCLPKSGATIVHSHWQIALASGTPYARVELWRRAAEQYAAATGKGYFDDLYELHDALGLALPALGSVRAAAHLTPLRNREIVLWMPASDDTLPNQVKLSRRLSVNAAALAHALYAVLRALTERHAMRSFNLAVILPPLTATAECWHGMPILARVADRGAALTLRSDWGAMELYGTGVITEDPFTIAEALRHDTATAGA